MSNKKHFQISQQAVEKLAVRFGTPLLVLSLEEIKKNYKVLKKYMPRVITRLRLILIRKFCG